MRCWARASAKRPILIAEPRYLSPDYFRPLRSEEGVLRNPNAADYRSAPVGVTEAFAAVARTGSVCVDIDADIAGYVSLLPHLHIVVVDIDRLVFGPRIFFASSNLLGPPTTEISSSSAGQAPRRTWVRWSAGSMGRMSFTSWCFAEPCRSR